MGIHYAIGGTGAIVQGMVKLIKELNGRFHYNTEVDEILVENGRAVGIRLQRWHDS